MKPRHHLYFDEALTVELEALASKPGASKSAIVSKALREFLKRRATREIDDMLKLRLDRISSDLGKLRRDFEVILESLSLFVRHYLVLNARVPEGDDVARAIALERFTKFVTKVGRQIATGKRTIGVPDEEVSE